MSDNLLITKVLADDSQPNIIERPNLIKKLRKNLDKKLIAIIAGAGFGKTTLVKEFLDKYEIKNCWFRIDNTDDNIFNLFSYINLSIKQIYPQFGKASEELIPSLKSRSNSKSSISNISLTIGSTLINDISNNIKEEFYLILDDFHLFPKADWVTESMNILLERSPNNFHFIITSREFLQFDTSFLISKRKIFELKTDELKFEIEESKALARYLYNFDFDEKHLNLLLKKTNGWITGLHLLLQSGVKDIDDKFNLYHEAFYNFFAENIFKALSDDTKSFLIYTCILENFTPKICNYLLNIKNSENIINELVAKNIFITKVNEYFDYQDLFRDFLYEKFKSSTNDKSQKSILKKAAEYYLLENNIIFAVKYFLSAADYKTAIKLITKNVHNIIDKGNINIVNKWLEAIPDEFVIDNPEIYYYKGVTAKNAEADYDKALKYFIECDKLSQKSKNKINTKANTQIAEIYINTGKIENAKKKLTSMLKQNRDSESEASILYWLGVAYYQNSEYNKSEEFMQKALEIANIESFKELKFDISNILGNIYLIRGNFTKSIFYYENIIDKSENIYHKFQTLTNIVQLYSHSGQYEKAKTELDNAKKMESQYPSPFFRINYLLSETHFYYMLGDYKKTINIWEEFLVLVKKRGLVYYTYLSYLSLGYCYFYLQKYNKAEQCYQLAKEYVKELSEGEKVDLDFSIAVLNKKNKPSPQIENELLKAYNFFKENNMVYNQVQVSYHLADYFFKKGYYEKVDEYLGEFLKTSEEYDYISLVQSEILFDRTLFDYAIENKICLKFIQTIFNSIIDIKELGWLSDEFKLMFNGLLENLYDINVSFLGEFTIKFRGKQVTDDLWVRKIRKYIFAFILLNRKRNLTKEDIIETFYPESTPENADNVFYQLLSNIRAIFKVEYKQNNKVLLISHFKYEDKLIEINPYYIYKVDVEEFEKIYKEVSGFGIGEKRKTELIERAIELYKGNFLDNYYENWSDELRDKFKDMYIEMLEKITEIYLKKQDYEKIAKYSERLIKTDHLNEEAYINLIKSHLKLFNNTSAKSVAKQMMKYFKKELGEQPSEESLKFIKPLL